VLFLLSACVPGAPCPDGATRREDGLCYAEAVSRGPTADEVVAALPPCTLDAAEANGRLDLDGRCVDGACAGDSYADMNAGVGEEGYCDGGWLGSGASNELFAICSWTAGFWSAFPGIAEETEPYDFFPEPGVATGWPIYVDGVYSGTTPEGLGLYSPLACWIDALGEPDGLDFEWGDDEPVVSAAWWLDRGVDLVYRETEPSLVLEKR
jgi:hypothetical protein